jgi:hypothetical protein
MVARPKVGPAPHVLVQASWALSGTYSSHIVSPGNIESRKILAPFEFRKVPKT